MATKANTSSVKMEDGLKNAYLATLQRKNNSVGEKDGVTPDSKANEQRKNVTAAAKAKAKKKAKMAKASRKKNK